MTIKLTVLAVAITVISANASAQTRPAPAAKVDPAVLYEQANKFDSGNGVPRDSAKALTMYRQAAELGSTDAMLRLGYLYENGKAVPQDSSQAADWYRRAGESGHPKAMFMLGVCYWAGRGVPQDLVEAYKWIDLAALYAADRDQDTANQSRVALARVMSSDLIEDAKKRVRDWQAAFDKRKG